MVKKYIFFYVLTIFLFLRLGSREFWSRRQAELFVATQAALVTNNEEKAVSPAELQVHIKNLLKSNPNLAEAVRCLKFFCK